MAKDWERLAGETGKRVDTSRFGRALKLGGVAARFGGSVIKAGLTRRRGDDEDATMLTTAAMRNAQHIVDVMSEMKGAAMKIGQILSADPDIVTPEFASRLAQLQNQSVPMDFGTVRAQIENALDRPLDAVFRFFDPESIGSASIGQVHRATLFDGRDVAVKVQYPGIVASLDSDLKNLASMLKVGRVFMTKERTEEFVREARAGILAEADYRAEGENLARFHAMLKERPQVRVPAPILEYTTSEVLVMEYIEGIKLDDALRAMTDRSARSAVAERFIRLYVWMFHHHHVLHADPHPGNFLLDTEGNLVLLDFGCIKDFEPELTDGILRMLVAFWDDDMTALADLFREFRFGKEGGTMPTEQVLREYHRMILEPLLEDRPFNFAEWKVNARIKQYLLRHLDLVRLVPPAELLMYARVLSGVKGLLTRIDVDVNLRPIAEEACRQRGLLA